MKNKEKFIKKVYIKNIIRKYLLLIVSIFLILLWLVLWSIDYTKDFWLNFFTEMLWVWITILFIDKITQYRKEIEEIPRILATYEDIRLYTSRYISFWVETFNICVPEKNPDTIDKFFSKDWMPKILNYLWLNSEPNVTPKRKWWDWIVTNAKEFIDSWDKILDRNWYLLEPKIYSNIHYITESTFIKVLSMIKNLRSSDLENWFKRVEVLKYYSTLPTDDDFKTILELYNRCEEVYFKYNNNPNIKRVYQYTNTEYNEKNIKCKIPEEILEKQIIEFKESTKS